MKASEDEVRPSTASPKRLGQLDDLRAIAVTLVVLMHGYSAYFPRPSELLNPFLIFIYGGGTGVTLFFILSGYLVSMPFILARRSGANYRALEHFQQRALRILPTYYFYVLISCILFGSFDKFIPALLFLSNGRDIGIYSGVWWSLATEVQFYLLIPILFFLNKRILIACGIISVLLYLYCAHFLVLYDTKAHGWLALTLLFKAPAFLAGAVIALIIADGRVHIHSRVKRLVLFVITLTLLTFFLHDKAINDRAGYSATRPYDIIPESLLWGGVFFIFLMNNAAVFGGASRFLAKISFSLYLVHFPVIFIGVVLASNYGLTSYSEKHLSLASSLLLSTLLAWISYKVVEEPFLRLKNKIRAPHKLARDLQ